MIQLQSVRIQLGTKVLLDGADMAIHPGQKWGIIGTNGAGKSSLFKLLLRQIHEDEGHCSIPKDWQISHMAQEVEGSGRSALDYIIDGDAELRVLQKAMESEHTTGEQLAHLFEKMETIDGYSAESRAQRLLKGLGFKPEDDQRPVTDFSGGWRIRLNLAKALMCRSDLLLLDEPTNHLDLDATLWLEQWLQQYRGTLLIISHDRDFLDNVVEGIVSFEAQKLITYSGNYSSFERQKAERISQQNIAFEKQQERMKDIEDFVRRFRAKASKAKQAQSRLKELERMESLAPAHMDSPFNFRFPQPEKIPTTLINMTDASIGYTLPNGDQKVLADKIQLSVLASSRIGLLGHNGAGKTTLIKTLADALPLLGGDKAEGLHTQVGYYAQHQLEALDIEASPALHLQRLSPKASEQEIRNFLGGFGFQGDRAFEVITHFSGGEKARLALAILAWLKPNILIMDEPTNHLDLEMRHALTIALQAFEGALIVVSHDRHLLKNTVEEFLLVDDGKVQEFNGTLEDYQQWTMQQKNDDARAQKEKAKHKKDKAKKAKAEEPVKNIATEAPKAKTAEHASGLKADKVDKKEQRQNAAAIREKLKPLNNQIKKLERDMESLQSTLAKLESDLADSSLYEGNSDKLNKLLKEQADAKAKLDSCEAEWMEKSEELEALQNS